MSEELRLKAAKRLLAAREAQDSLLKFMRLTMAHASDPDDADKSLFQETPLARLLCTLMQEIYHRKLKRVAVSVGPQMGKSQVLSRGAPAWMMGKDPRLNVILGTYNQPFANEFGDSVREIMASSAYAQVFKTELRKSATDLLITKDNGRAAFVGRGGSGTGKPADIFLVDDPLKDDIEAQSDLTREEVWKWFNKVALTRCHSNSAIVVVHTRWHQDDLIGRLCDPDHPERNKLYAGIADRWTYINLPAVIDNPNLAAKMGLTLTPSEDPFVRKMFGVKPISSIWPERKGLEFLAEAKQMDSAGFTALYMGKPTPDDGDYFKAENIKEYDVRDLPQNLRKYAASDHAVSTKQDRDYTVLGCVGIDERDNIWVLPDLVWDRMESDRTVDEIIHQMKTHRPQLWWMEDELISKSFGPFLRKRMIEEKVYMRLDPVRPAADKKTRARSIQGRMSHGKVFFPRFAPWWPEARAQLLRFPNGTNDDFVDFLAHIGLGLLKEMGASQENKEGDRSIVNGSVEAMLRQTKLKAMKENMRKAVAGW